MLRTSLRTASLGGASVIALTIGLAQVASAQDKPGFYLGLQGTALWSTGTSFNLPTHQFSPGLRDTIVDPAGDGAGAKITAGYQFHGPWSVEANVAGNWLETTTDRTSTIVNSNQGGTFVGSVDLNSRANYYLADFDAGYTIQLGEGRHIRLLGGVQYGNFHVDRNMGVSYSYVYNNGPTIPLAGVSNAFTIDSHFWGIGPKIGMDGKYRLGRSDFSIVGGVSGSVLFGQLTNSSSAYYSYSNEQTKSHTAYGINANVGVAYQLPYVNFDSSITVGMQVDQWWNIAEQPDLSGNATQNVNLTSWGPLLKWETHF